MSLSDSRELFKSLTLKRTRGHRDLGLLTQCALKNLLEKGNLEPLSAQLAVIEVVLSQLFDYRRGRKRERAREREREGGRRERVSGSSEGASVRVCVLIDKISSCSQLGST